MKDKQKSARSTTSRASTRFSDEERAAMKERSREAKASAEKADGESEVLAKIAGNGSHDGRADPCHREGRFAGHLAANVVRDARVRQGRQRRLLLPAGAEVQAEVRDAGLQRQGEARRWRHVADLLRPAEADARRRGEDRRADRASGELRTDQGQGATRWRTASFRWSRFPP